MYPFWESVIAPMIAVSGGKRIVEIGALRGETTAKLLDDLGPDAEVHVIDPVPAFDPAEHEQRFGGRYVFHRDLSLNVLDDIGAFDIAIIDGDHNWYTVYNELRALARTSRAAGQALPLCILHDVTWPYGRRDLYYVPEQIPEEFRQPYDHRGMRPGRATLLPGGGMNHTLANALEEGGERNGVRTGMEDFIAEHDRPTRSVVIPIYFGLAIVAEEALLAEQPELAAYLDRIESPEGTRELLDLSESIRLEGVVFQQNIERVRFEQIKRAIDRHVDVLRSITEATTAEVRAADDAVALVLDQPELVGDIVYAGSPAGLRYLADVLDANEVAKRSIWAIGDGLDDVVAERSDRIIRVDPGSVPDTPVAATSIAAADDQSRVATVLGERLDVGSVISDADRQSVR